MSDRKWEYRVSQDRLPPGATSPVPDCDGLEWWLNDMDRQGWEFVGPAVKKWSVPDTIFTWWVFRRPVRVAAAGEGT